MRLQSKPIMVILLKRNVTASLNFFSFNIQLPCSLILLMIDRLKPTFVTDLKMAIEKCGKITQKRSLKRNPCKQNAYAGHERVKVS